MVVAGDDLVWYVAYGSNLAAERLEAYLSGGSVSGSARVYPGCRDRSPAAADRAVTIPHRLAIGRHSPRWDGGVAFIDPTREPGVATHGRAWLIRRSQLGDLAAQECGGDTADVPADLWVASAGDAVTICDGWYGLAVVLDSIDRRLAVTLTHRDWPPPAGVATDAYLHWMRTGLAEAGHGGDAVETYLSALS